MRYKYIFTSLFLLLLSTAVRSWSQEFISAEPLGGERQLREFINEEIMYPEIALVLAQEGTVKIAIDIDENGKPLFFKVAQGISPELNTEALRIARFIVFKPASYRGKNVNSVYRMEVPFQVKKYRKIVKKRGYNRPALPYQPVDSSLQVFNIKDIDKAPEPLVKGQYVNLSQFISKNFKYPEEALRKSITGTVTVNFIIEPHGRCSNVNTLTTIGAGCTEEAIRLVKMLQWVPGIRQGKAVRVSVTLPVTFMLPDDSRFKSPQSPGGTTLY